MGDLIGFLLGTRRVVMPEGSTWEFTFATPVSPVWYVLAGLVVTAGVTALYWRESVPLTTRQRLTFVALRTLVVVVILVMLAEPSIFVSTTSQRLASVAVLIDTSESMSLNDAYEDDALRTHAALAAGLVETPAPGAPASLGPDHQRRLQRMTRVKIVQAALRPRLAAGVVDPGPHVGRKAAAAFDELADDAGLLLPDGLALREDEHLVARKITHLLIEDDIKRHMGLDHGLLEHALFQLGPVVVIGHGGI